MSDELLDLLDEHGNPTGQTATRSEVHANRLWHRSVHVWVVNTKGEILIQKRSPLKDLSPNRWELSHGGHLEAGQQPLDGAIREVKEELGIDLAPEQLEYCFETTHRSKRSPNNEFNPIFLAVLNLPISAFTFDDGEVSELRWMDQPELEAWTQREPDIFALHTDEEPQMLTLIRQRFGAK
ncbi:MAG: NUDIX domain-containing protein [Patescibacteria group bacterium]